MIEISLCGSLCRPIAAPVQVLADDRHREVRAAAAAELARAARSASRPARSARRDHLLAAGPPTRARGMPAALEVGARVLAPVVEEARVVALGFQRRASRVCDEGVDLLQQRGHVLGHRSLTSRLPLCLVCLQVAGLATSSFARTIARSAASSSARRSSNAPARIARRARARPARRARRARRACSARAARVLELAAHDPERAQRRRAAGRPARPSSSGSTCRRARRGPPRAARRRSGGRAAPGSRARGLVRRGRRERGGGLLAAGIEQLEQVPLDLARAAADHGVLDRASRAGQVA